MIKLIPLLFIFTTVAHAKGFKGEAGNYDFNFKHVVDDVTANNYISLKSDYENFKGFYKLDESRNEYKLKDWYKQDWFALQDMFSFNQEAYIRSFGEQSFNEAKRAQYEQFAFDAKKHVNKKFEPALSEWGGLTHPPLRSLSMPLKKYHSKFAPIKYSKIESAYFNPKLQQKIDEASGSELTFGNKLKVLMDNDSFKAKKELIKKAKSSILLSSLVFVCDESSKEILNLLIERKRAGVDVRVMVDNMITTLLMNGECIKRLKKENIEVILVKDFFKYEGSAIYHSKVLVVDLLEAIAGGQNLIGADNTSRGTDFKNRDADLHMKGPMVADVATGFLVNWERHRSKYNSSSASLLSVLQKRQELERKNGLRGKEIYQQKLANSQTRMNGVCRFISQAPYRDRQAIGKAYLLLLNEVKNQLVITDPLKNNTLLEKKTYEMVRKLTLKVQSMAKNGIHIDYISTNKDMAGNEFVAIMNEDIRKELIEEDYLAANFSLKRLNFLNDYFGKSHYENLVNDFLHLENINIWLHISFMHSKIFYFDRIVASIGSLNFQKNATDQAYESTAICMDESLNDQLDKVLVLDMANSLPFVKGN